MKIYHKQMAFKPIFAILMISLPLWSCKKFVDTKPTTKLLSEYIFDTDQSILSALNGAYVQFANPGNASFTSPAQFADELTTVSDQASTNNTYTIDSDYGFFDKYYTAIYDANFILEGIDHAPKITPATAAIVKGEALFLRAFSYFQLVNYYGNVPYFTITDPNATAYIGNTPMATTYQNIIADLKAASGLLTNAYPAANRTRANKQVVNALLAKAYLYTKDWTNAASAATDVIGSGLYSINTNLNTVFSSTSNETIFQLWNNTGVALGSAFIQSSPTTSLIYTVRPELKLAYGPTDLRKGTWIQLGTGPAVATDSYFVSKYKIKGTGTGQLEYPIVFRLAELYLIRAEALAQQNTPVSIAAGATDLEVTRRRAGLITPLVITSSPQLLIEVAAERRKELSFEFGNRWFDLNRTGQTVAVLSAIKPNIDTHIMLLPYLRQYPLLNKNLIQNPGYDK